MEIKTFSLELPTSGGTETVKIESGQSIVIVGANGSGKTRLGTWIELDSSDSRKVHRVAAQKSLSMPEYSSTASLEVAEIELYTGRQDYQNVLSKRSNFAMYKRNSRWGGKPNTFLLDDFQKLMVLLFTDDYEKSAGYLRKLQSGEAEVPMPVTKLDTIKRIWESVLPHRELEISAGKIQTHLKNSTSDFYNASEMSDGERVIFYLIGQALAAPQDGIVIIDEPELHLHRSIQTRLWREIQAERLDCLFVYMTHDVEFAASLTEAKKIWLKSFDGQLWEWEEVPTVEGFPEELLIQVLGSRVPILFVEGDHGSHDVALFRVIYPNHTVIPRGSCSEVILATKALREATQFHHVQAYGIVDRDRLNSDQIPRLKSEGIEVLNVAEIENLFCVPEVLKLVAVQQGLPADVKLEDAKNFVLKELRGELDTQISLHVANEIKFRLNVFDTKKKGAEALKAELESRAKSIDVEAIYVEVQKRFNDVIQNRDYIAALALFNRKGLVAQLSGMFGIKNLPDFVLRMVQGDNSQDWSRAFSNYMPNLSS